MSLRLLSVPVYALDSYQPENYISDIKVDGDIKTVSYLFDNGYPLTNLWSQPSGSKYSYSGQFGYLPRDGTTSFTTRTYFLGKEAYDGQIMPAYSSVDVGDILELAPVSISSKFSIQLNDFSGVPEGIGAYSVRYSIGFFAYDSNGDYIGTFYGSNETKEMNSYDVFDFVARYDASLPSGIKYMLPFISGAFTKTGANTTFDQTNIQITPWYFQMDVDINMIYEQSQTMQRIEEEIGEVGDKIDDTNDKLDGIDDTLEDIYTGGDGADDLIGAGDDLEAKDDILSGEAGDLSGDIGEVGNFEGDAMDGIASDMSSIDIKTGVGDFSGSLMFVTGYVNGIFNGFKDWQIALTLPMFLGLFFGICQHVGGVTNMRARHVREARAEELHQARLDKIKGGHK